MKNIIIGLSVMAITSLAPFDNAYCTPKIEKEKIFSDDQLKDKDFKKKNTENLTIFKKDVELFEKTKKAFEACSSGIEKCIAAKDKNVGTEKNIASLTLLGAAFRTYANLSLSFGQASSKILDSIKNNDYRELEEASQILNTFPSLYAITLVYIRAIADSLDEGKNSPSYDAINVKKTLSVISNSLNGTGGTNAGLIAQSGKFDEFLMKYPKSIKSDQNANLTEAINLLQERFKIYKNMLEDVKNLISAFTDAADGDYSGMKDMATIKENAGKKKKASKGNKKTIEEEEENVKKKSFKKGRIADDEEEEEEDDDGDEENIKRKSRKGKKAAEKEYYDDEDIEDDTEDDDTEADRNTTSKRDHKEGNGHKKNTQMKKRNKSNRK